MEENTVVAPADARSGVVDRSAQQAEAPVGDEGAPQLATNPDLQLGTELTISRFEGKTDNRPKRLVLGTVDDLVRWLRDYPRIERDSKNGPAFSAAAFREGGKRSKRDVISISAVVLDLDGKRDGKPAPFDLEALVRKFGYRCVAYSSHSHTAEQPRVRLVFPLPRPISVKEYARLWAWLDDATGRVCDSACKDPARMFFLPSRLPASREDDHFIREFEGPLLSLDSVPATFAVQRRDGRARAVAADPRRTPGAARGSRPRPSSNFPEAAAAFNHDNPLDHLPPSGTGTCPYCNHHGCFGRMPEPSRWSCLSTNHTSGGVQGDAVWTGDALDLAAHARKLSRREVLKADGYLDAARTPGSSPQLASHGGPGDDVELDGTDQPVDQRQRLFITTNESACVNQALRNFGYQEELGDLFQRGSSLVRIRREEEWPAEAPTERPGPRIESLPKASLRELLTAVFNIGREVPKKAGGGVDLTVGASATGPRLASGEQGEAGPLPDAPEADVNEVGGETEDLDEHMDFKKTHPPPWLVDQIWARGQWPMVRSLTGLVDVPVLRRDGTVLDAAGYDQATGLFLSPSFEVEPVADAPTRADAQAAVSELHEVVQDFPFELPVHRAAWLAALLTLFARYSYSGPTPIFVITSNIRGAGKGKLVSAIASIATGGALAGMPMSPFDEEMRKQITRVVMSGTRIVNLDNVATTLGSPSLDSALTASSWSDRILGTNDTLEAPMTVTFFATGNNLEYAGDTIRRAMPIKLASPDERPERRTGFAHPDLGAWIAQERARLVRAVLTVLRAYHVAGAPKKALPQWGSFEAWSDAVRQAVVWVGEPDPIGACELQLEEGDRDAKDLRALHDGWLELDPGGDGMTVRAALHLLELRWDELAHARVAVGYEKMRAAITEVFPSLPLDRLPEAGRLGKKLQHFRDRRASGRMLVALDEKGGSKVWAVRGVDGHRLRPEPGPPPQPEPSGSPEVPPEDAQPADDNFSPAAG